MPAARADPTHLGYLRASLPQLRSAFSDRMVDARDAQEDAGSANICLWRVNAHSLRHKDTLLAQLLAKGFVLESR